MGTKGEIQGDMSLNQLTMRIFGEDKENITIEKHEGGHGGGDLNVMKRFINALKYDWNTDDDLRIALLGHFLVFAAEEARKTHQVVDFETFMEDIYRGNKTS